MIVLRRTLRRTLWGWIPVASTLGAAGLVVQDRLSQLPLLVWVPSVFAIAGVTVRPLARARVRRWLNGATGRSYELLAREQFELGGGAGVLFFGVLGRLDPHLAAGLYPFVYVLVAICCTFASSVAAAAIIALLLGIEGAICSISLGDGSFDRFALHAGFIALFSSLNLLLVRTELTRIRVRSRARVTAEIGKLRDAARSYRLLGNAGSDAKPIVDEDRLARSSVEEIHEAVLFALELLRRSLGLHTAMLLWLTDAETHVRVSEVSSAEDELNDGPFVAGDGVIGAAIARKSRVLLQNVKPTYKVPYYPGGCPVRTICAIPVIDREEVRGVLIADRVKMDPFTVQEEELLESATRFVLRAIQNERLFMQLERAKMDQGKLYRAARSLGAALTEADVVDAGVKSAREVALFDFAAVTLFDEAQQLHEIRAVSGAEGEKLLGATFTHNAGLCSMVVQNRHPLPYRGEFDATKHVLFAKKVRAPTMPSMLVLPLQVHGRPLGTLVLGANRRGAFGDSVRPTLEVLASHVAVSLANARMLRKLEEMATTDGLTGLLNKRAMMEMAEQKVAAASRFSRKLSVLVTDIDFFKKVNDTYGHDVGDVVIKGLGDILRKVKRTTDAVARFGGEEFVVVCEETDEKGAWLLAERVRLEVEATAFSSPMGPLQVTCSIGIATFPEAGRSWEALFKAADTALYASKRNGRNRVTAFAATARRVVAQPPIGLDA